MGGPRIFHYTVGIAYDSILHDGLIIPATRGVPPGERPAVWFSVNPSWEPTANKGVIDGQTGHQRRLTREETEELGCGLVRIEVAEESAPHRWQDYLRLSGVRLPHARNLEKVARKWGANVHHYRVSFDPVPMAKWLSVEVWRDTAWIPTEPGRAVLYHRVDRALALSA